jgi:hypothetical protein
LGQGIEYRYKSLLAARKEKRMISTVWTREDIPYDAMGDYSRFCFAGAKEEDHPRLPRAESENENEGNNDQ